MALKITDTEMTSDITRQAARFSENAAADGGGAWLVPWVPARLLTQNQAVTAMTIAEAVIAHTGDDDEFADWRKHVDGWAAELGITGPWAILRVQAAELAAADAAAAASSDKVNIQYVVTTLPMGRKTKVNFSAHVLGEPAPYEVAAMMVPVDSRRPRGDAGQYLAELMTMISFRLSQAAEAPTAGHPGATPLPFGAES
jgi:hypothetical protein